MDMSLLSLFDQFIVSLLNKNIKSIEFFFFLLTSELLNCGLCNVYYVTACSDMNCYTLSSMKATNKSNVHLKHVTLKIKC